MKLDGHIYGLLQMLGTIYRWCVTAFSNDLWNILTLVVLTQVKIDALCEQRWSLEQHPEKKSGHMLHLLCHQGRERFDWRVEWPSVVFSNDSWFCLYARDGRTRVWHKPGEHHLTECIRPRHSGPTSDFVV